MPDELFEDPQLAALYDAACPWDERGDFAFYFPMLMKAGSVLDVGCGTGSLLHRARAEGHEGRLVGLDPATGMLERARRRADIEWIQGDRSAVSFESEFELVVMTGHAFQVLLTDEEIRDSLTAIRRALTDEGRFAFETRNPGARAWERWPEDYSGTLTSPNGATVRHVCEVHQALRDGLVKHSHTYNCPDWPAPRVSHSTLRFLDEAELDRLLKRAGLSIDERYGNWDRSPVAVTSPEIITIARPSER